MQPPLWPSLWQAALVPTTVGLSTVGLSIFGLSTVGLSTVGLSTVGLPTVGLFTVDLSTVGLSTVGLSTVGLSTVGLSTVGLSRTLQSWRTRRLETLQQRVQVLEVFVLSKAWYIAHLLPLATSPAFPGQTVPATRFGRLVVDFLWAGRFWRLAFDECYAERSAGGLGLSCTQTRAQAMLANQTCRHLAAGGRPALHLAYWLGISLQGLLPTSAGLRLEGDPPSQYADLLSLLREVFTLLCVDTPTCSWPHLRPSTSS
jgi:hypothetical protein